MSPTDRDGLISRIRQIRAVAPPEDRSARESPPSPPELQSLEQRIVHLEALVVGLQDSVHREFERHAKLLDELRERVEPGAMGAALADDARTRGL